MMRVGDMVHLLPVAIIDIGSNSIRLVVYDGRQRTPVPLFNEKAVCALGLGMGSSGRLNPEGVGPALLAVGRFVELARAMGAAGDLHILATAAVRDAADGAWFVSEIERRTGVPVTVLSGGEEAEVAALGVLCSIPEAQGVVADLGGGSLELVHVDGGHLAEHVTMPLGLLRLTEASDGDRERASEVIDQYLGRLDWLDAAAGQSLYVVGGAWRALARICIAQANHPLLVLDNFTLPYEEALNLTDLISRQSKKSLERVPGVSKKRAPYLPLAALLLEKVLGVVRPSRLVFSVYGMREGQFYKMLPDAIRAQDPLVASCDRMARMAGRFPEHAAELMSWMDPLFPVESEQQRRLRLAACLLGDIFWDEHPDYRSEQAFLRTLRMPFMGLGHQDRAALALAVFTRYGGDDEHAHAIWARQLLGEDEVLRARSVGNALRVAHTLSGGAPGLLSLTRLVRSEDCLVLEVPADHAAFAPDMGGGRFEKLAKCLDFASVMVKRV